MRPVTTDFSMRCWKSALFNALRRATISVVGLLLAAAVHAQNAELEALRVDHADEVLDQITDDHGNFIPLDLIDAAVRQAVADRGGVDL